jgi:UDP-N-acetylglucosamine:LPS N-acetylglucosamine transferase
MKRILFLTFYYSPDLSAGSFRATELAKSLAAIGAGRVEVDVLTTLPNRYASFSVDVPAHEEAQNLRIKRFAVPRHRSGMLDQSKTFVTYAAQVFRAINRRRYDLVFATSSRLMTAVLAAAVSQRFGAPLYLDIRDIFTETMEHLLEDSPYKSGLKLFKVLETYTIRRAERVNLVSEAFREYFEQIDPTKQYRLYTNGIDDEFLSVSFENHDQNLKPLIVYAGNIGHSQGLHHVIPDAACQLKDRVDFLIVGDGSARPDLENALHNLQVDNVVVQPPVPRSQLVELYRRADYLLLHLNSQAAFHRVLPSKIFEYAATLKPILAGVAGYPRTFLVQHVPGAEVFDPCDVEGLIHAYESLSRAPVPRQDFINQFSRVNIVNDMAADILETLHD